MEILFPFADYWWFYMTFTLFVLLMLALDLGVFHRTAHEVSFKEATIWSAVWVILALLFNVVLYYYASSKFGAEIGREVSLEFLAGYIVEKSLSVDNIFVFVVVFSYFAIPAKYQHRVLFYGILGALVFRALFISAGAWLMQFKIVVYFFGVLLIFTGIKMILSLEKEIEPEKNPVIKLFRRFVPVTSRLEGQNFFIRKDGKIFATPLFIALLFLELTDIIFAIDSVPAIFALTKEPMIVYTSNIFAILGLRAMYFMLAGVINKFHYLKYGLAVVLIFVGLKMVWLNEAFGGKFPISWSLGFIATVVFVSILFSLIFPARESATLKK
ncbi:MAG: TerC family protein [Pyrinomonadaceae bacterium]|nr:TerC family protein [Pyrinomonadaceae bacterium]MCX7639997.1 TerC family protein [Pyrinomonadaceae bacterium]MDW8304169.1 TerC family protein [Acidobacteriota bacterium]